MTKSRRDFLRDTACGLTAAAVVNSLDRLSLVNAMVQQQNSVDIATDYKALVCVFLSGGSDCNNMIVPLDAEYAAYSSVRAASGLAIAQSALLPINPLSGRQFGLHPNLSPEVATTAQLPGLLAPWTA